MTADFRKCPGANLHCKKPTSASLIAAGMSIRTTMGNQIHQSQCSSLQVYKEYTLVKTWRKMNPLHCMWGEKSWQLSVQWTLSKYLKQISQQALMLGLGILTPGPIAREIHRSKGTCTLTKTEAQTPITKTDNQQNLQEVKACTKCGLYI